MATTDPVEETESEAKKDEPAKDKKPDTAQKDEPAKEKNPDQAGIHVEDLQSGVLKALGKGQFGPKDIPVEDLADGIVNAFGLGVVVEIASDAVAKAQDLTSRLKDFARKKTR
ncbi:MAG: hypothetical protein V3R66_03375 [Rhodospirillales bacterium]